MHISAIILIFCWVLFLLYWGITALSVKKAKVTQGVQGMLWHQIQIAVSFLLLAGIIPLWPFNQVVWSHSALTDGGGAFLGVVGVAVAIWARRTLAGNWSSSVTFKHDHQLIVNGPYGWVRHPIYTGILLMMLGTALSLGRLDSILGFVLRYFYYVFSKIKTEENILTQHFSKAYPAYQKRTKALIPFLW